MINTDLATVVVKPVPPLPTPRVPVKPDIGIFVQLDRLPERGVPRNDAERVLLDKVSLFANVAKTPDDGSVRFVVLLEVKVMSNAGVVVKLPPTVIVLLEFATPVPPYIPAITLPFQVLLVRVFALESVIKVPDDGSVTFVLAPTVRVVLNAPPAVVKLPARVIVLPLLLTPVPPYNPAITLLFQVLLVSVSVVSRPIKISDVVGSVKVGVPAAAAGVIVTVPLVISKLCQKII